MILINESLFYPNTLELSSDCTAAFECAFFVLSRMSCQLMSYPFFLSYAMQNAYIYFGEQHLRNFLICENPTNLLLIFWLFFYAY